MVFFRFPNHSRRQVGNSEHTAESALRNRRACRMEEAGEAEVRELAMVVVGVELVELVDGARAAVTACVGVGGEGGKSEEVPD